MHGWVAFPADAQAPVVVQPRTDAALPRSHLINTTQARQEDKRSESDRSQKGQKRQVEQDYPVYSLAKKGTKWRKPAV